MQTDTHTQRLMSSVAPRALEIKKDDPPPAEGEAALIAGKLAKAFEEFKSANDQQLAELKKGLADVVTEDKLKKLGDDLDKLQKAKDEAEKKTAAKVQEQFDEIAKQLAHAKLAGNGDAADKKAAELETFNLEIKSLAAVYSRAAPPALDQAGYDGYRAGFKSYLKAGREGFAGDERKTMTVGSDPDGGYLVPTDTSGRIVTRRFDLSPIRQIAAVQSISTEALDGLRDRGEPDAGWVGETAARPETDAPTVAKYSIPAHEIYANPAASQKLLEDAAVNLEAWLGGKVGDKFARVEGAGFVTGNGVNKPRGLATYTTAATGDDSRTDGQIEHVATGASGAFASTNPADKLFDLIGAFNAFYLQNARWLTRREVITLIRKFKDGMGQYLWQPGLQAGQPQSILGYPVTTAQDMPAVAASSLSMALGDFREGYQIVDRLAIQVLRDPYTNKPYVHFYTRARVGGAVINFDAVKFLKFAAS